MSLYDDEQARAKYFAQVEKVYEKEVAAIYKDALDEIRVEMSKIYEKYAVNGMLTNAEMTKYNRLQSLEQKIQSIIKPAVKDTVKIVDALKPEEYGEAFWRTAWAMDNATGVALDWGPLDKNAIKESLYNVFYEEGVAKYGTEALSRVRTAISNGLALGQSYPEMMRDMKDMINRDNYEIMRILRTELHAAQEAGTSDAYDEAIENGVEGTPVWIATLDDRTRDTHGEMDGVEKDKDGFYHGAITAPYPGWDGLPAGERINCRCSERFQIDGFAPTIRRSRDDGIIPYQTWREWKENKTLFK